MGKSLDLLKGALGEASGKEEVMYKVVIDMDKEVEEDEVVKKEKKPSKTKKQYLSGEWVKTEWGWKWEGETDKDGYAIERKENDSATMYHIGRSGWYWDEGTGKDAKSYKAWDITFKRTGENILAYKKDGKLYCVKRVKKPFNLAQRLYETGHAYQQKGKEGWGGGEE